MRVENMRFDGEGKIVGFGLTKETLEPLIECGVPFRTSGCPDCNRPYYNERPGGVMYNYPRPLTAVEAAAELDALLAGLAEGC